MTLAEVMATLLIMPDCMSTELCCLYPNQILSLLLAPNLASLSKATFSKVLLLRDSSLSSIALSRSFQSSTFEMCGVNEGEYFAHCSLEISVDREEEKIF